jgi:predicted GNAT family N-acyltransferase
VFIEEQGIPAHLERDGRDALCRHVLARDLRGVTIGTGRLDAYGRIGRIAVLQSWRSHGVGSAVLDALVGLARVLGHREAIVHAQRGVAGFYRKAGFQEEGPPFDEAGIEHLKMVKTLASGDNKKTGKSSGGTAGWPSQNSARPAVRPRNSRLIVCG